MTWLNLRYLLFVAIFFFITNIMQGGNCLHLLIESVFLKVDLGHGNSFLRCAKSPSFLCVCTGSFGAHPLSCPEVRVHRC